MAHAARHEGRDQQDEHNQHQAEVRPVLPDPLLAVPHHRDLKRRMDLQKGPRYYASGPATKGMKQYHLNLEEIDELVSALLTGRVTPEWIASLLTFGDGKAQYERENLHRFF